MRNKKGQFVKGSKPSKKCIEAIRTHYKNTPKKRISLVCQTCRKKFQVYPYRTEARFCSGRCRSIKTGEIRRSNAIPILWSKYMFIKMPSYHRAKSGYAKVADLVLEKKLGRLLKKNEIAHHIDECKTNDSPDNLEVMTKFEHDKMHSIKRWKNGNFR